MPPAAKGARPLWNPISLQQISLADETPYGHLGIILQELSGFLLVWKLKRKLEPLNFFQGASPPASLQKAD
jgi:hypothetical protein